MLKLVLILSLFIVTADHSLALNKEPKSDSLTFKSKFYSIKYDEALAGFDSYEEEIALALEAKKEYLRDSLIQYAQQFIGLPYIWGGSTPYGFDCSGYTQYVYRHFAKEIPRTPVGQVQLGTFVEINDAKKGDIVFYGYPYGNTYYYGHTALVYSNDGQGNVMVIHSILPGLMITPIHFDPNPAVRFICIKRIIE